MTLNTWEPEVRIIKQVFFRQHLRLQQVYKDTEDEPALMHE